jgi:protein-S-isoprenylcysteine O-methyltransferase Ste14
MLSNPFQLIFLIGDMIFLFVIYGPSARRFRKAGAARSQSRPLDIALDMVVFLAWHVLPWIYIFSTWLDFADYSLPAWAGWIGAAVFAGALMLLWKAYHDLGQNWSPKIDIIEGQVLVTQGISGKIRHPIYAGLWLWAVALPLLLQNWIAGFAFPISFLILYLVRMPREEKMLRDQFGQEYLDYMEETGRIFPRLVK